jgi:hypothetical protein
MTDNRSLGEKAADAQTKATREALELMTEQHERAVKQWPLMRKKMVDAYLSEHGLVAVPLEPTEAMIHELEHGWDSRTGRNMWDNYRAMIAAASQGEAE